jgi:tRNA(Ile)-lysidine synthase
MVEAWPFVTKPHQQPRVKLKRIMDPFLESLQAATARLASGSSGLAVAVSGGADSVALLRGLAMLGGQLLRVAHVNHQLRGTESDDDETFVRMLADALGLPIDVIRIDTAALSRSRRANLESTARRERYDWLARVTADAGLTLVATAHTADDQAETVLHHLIRGTGLQGLRGVAPRRPIASGVAVVRPLLGVGRHEVRRFLESVGQNFREDRSNADRRFTRNRIRLELLPLLQSSFNPAIVANLARLAEQAGDAFDAIEELASQTLRQCERPAAGRLRILAVADLARRPRHLVRETLRFLWRREGWPVERMRFADWDRVAAVVFGELPAADLPGRIRVQRRGPVVQIGLTRELGPSEATGEFGEDKATP